MGFSVTAWFSGLGSGPGLWYATRATGLVALLLLTAATALGFLTAGRLSGERWPRFLVVGLHRNISLLALVFLSLHIATNVLDSYVTITIQDAVVPFLSGYHRFWLGLGVIASDILIALAVTSLLRQQIGHKFWRAVHWAGYLCWPVALAHGLGIGTDRSKAWVFYLTLACIAAVLVAAGIRLLSGLPSRRLAP